jgi:2-polyprenyl-6-methoxyphenol hydroxylase-like FAD-dependent oxidoreductase
MPELRIGNTSPMSRSCADVLVIGAGVAGLTVALRLARVGVPVDVLEQDRSPAPAGRRSAGTWRRAGVPQANHAHVFSPSCHRILTEQLPDVLGQLLELGARELTVRASDGGERMTLAVRRPMFDWVLRRVAEREPMLRVHNGVSVTGLRRRGEAGGALSGVVVSGGVLGASVAVDATGAVGAAEAWLSTLGNPLGHPMLPTTARRGRDAARVEYFSRDYVLHWPGDPSELNLGAAAGGTFSGYRCRVVPGDNNTFTVTFAVPFDDQHEVDLPRHPAGLGRLAGLAAPEGFEAAAHLVPLVSSWVDSAVAEPLGAVSVLSVPASSGRRMITGPGLPGLISVGDAWCTDDPCNGLGVASALASGLACARMVPDVLAGGEPDVGSIAAAVDEQVVDHTVSPPCGPAQELDGPGVAELTDWVARVTGISAVPV